MHVRHRQSLSSDFRSGLQREAATGVSGLRKAQRVLAPARHTASHPSAFPTIRAALSNRHAHKPQPSPLRRSHETEPLRLDLAAFASGALAQSAKALTLVASSGDRQPNDGAGASRSTGKRLPESSVRIERAEGAANSQSTMSRSVPRPATSNKPRRESRTVPDRGDRRGRRRGLSEPTASVELRPVVQRLS